MAQQPKIDWTDVDSSNIRSVAYDKDTETLCVHFHNGGLYTYGDVDQEVYVSLVHAESVGKYLNQKIKGVNPYIKWGDEQEMLRDIQSRKRK